MKGGNGEYALRWDYLMSGEDKCHGGLPSAAEAKKRFHWQALPPPAKRLRNNSRGSTWLSRHGQAKMLRKQRAG
jgi:hypothetical protein